MAKQAQQFRCTNQACTLGSRSAPGVFTGGATKEQITLLTGEPEPENYGAGICPNCGEPAEEYDERAVREEFFRDQIKQLQAELKGGGE